MSTTTAGAAPATAFSTRNSYPLSSPPPQKTIFQGVSIQDAKRSLSVSFNKTTDKTSAISKRNRGLEINARKTAGASKQIEVEVDKPLGLTLGPKPGSGGGVVITGVDGGGNAAKAGLKVGDQVIYTSSFFGDELWPADRLGFTKTAIQAVPDSVYFVVSRGVDVDVKRLPKRPAPPRFGRKLTDAQKPDGYLCPQCRAPKKRFTRYDPATGKPIGGTLPPIGVIIGLVAGLAGVGALLVYGLQ
ncbi:putative PDZ domain-containing protein [Helianthus annuus]|nr:putative PDZ domain-containing protein [Helianthus annuus]